MYNSCQNDRNNFLYWITLITGQIYKTNTKLKKTNGSLRNKVRHQVIRLRSGKFTCVQN